MHLLLPLRWEQAQRLVVLVERLKTCLATTDDMADAAAAVIDITERSSDVHYCCPASNSLLAFLEARGFVFLGLNSVTNS